MLLTETFSYQIGTIKTKNGNNMRVAYIDAHRSQDTYGIRKKIQSYGAKWEPKGKWWYWILGNDPEGVIRNQVKPCIEYLTKIEDMGGEPKRNVEDVINKLISKVKGATMPSNLGGASSKDDILANLEKFKADLVRITSDEEFKRIMEPIIKFRNASGGRYSLLNTILILVQDPEATMVKSASNWKEANKTIKKGAKAISLWFPKGKREYTPEEQELIKKDFLMKKKVKSVEELTVGDREKLRKEMNRTVAESFDLGPYWYDIRFTEQIPGTEDLVGNPGDDVKWFDDSGDETPELAAKIDATLAVIEEEGITLKFSEKIGSGDARGVSKSGSIEILEKQPRNAGMLNTIIHEFAHEILHQTYLKTKNEEMKDYFVGTSEGRGKVEQQAELCAWIVMRSFGYDMQTNINYVGIWGLNQDNAVKVFDSVSRVATLISQKVNKKEQETANMTESKHYIKENGIPSGEEIANMVGCGEVYQRAKKHMMRRQPTMENAVLGKNKNKSKNMIMNKNNAIRLTESELKNVISESVKKILKEEFGVDMEDTLSWVRKKKPNMSPEEQQRFAQNIINKRNKGTSTSTGPVLSTYDEVRKAVIEYMNEKWPGDYENGKTHYKAALKALGFRNDGYDMYGANAYTNGKVRVTVYYDRGDCYWDMEEAQGYSATTDNFYNTSSEMRDSSGVYGRGSYEDPWNR